MEDLGDAAPLPAPTAVW